MTEEQGTDVLLLLVTLKEIGVCVVFLMALELGRKLWDDLHHKRPWDLGERML